MSEKSPPAYGFEPVSILVARLSIDITPEWAWGGSEGQNVKVGVIDSGIDADHPDIGGRVAGYVAIKKEGDQLVYDTEPHKDAYGHGTACAGVIRSIAPACELYSIKVLGAGLIGSGVAFAAGLRWAIENGLHVCNLSLGTTKADFYAILHELTDLAYFKNVVLVAAANNISKPSFPSVYASVVSVSSHADANPYLFYCNPEPPVEFSAHGIDVHVPWLRGGYLTATGNSFAAPHMTGIVAKILGKHPDLTQPQVRMVLQALATNAKSG
jgi:subtilisin family serine protease